MARKFIIQDNLLKVGNVEMHFELKNKKGGRVVGGGFWHINDERTILFLYGKSIDFGSVTADDLREIRGTGMASPSIEKMEWKYFDSDKISDVLEQGQNI